MSKPALHPTPSLGSTDGKILDEKFAAEHVEEAHGNEGETGTAAVVEDVISHYHGLASQHDNLPLLTAFKVHWKSSLFAFLAAFAAATDGYQIGLAGNLIANPGFIEVMSTTTANGKPIISANVLTAIGTIQSVGQFIGMTTMPFLSDKFGRKWCMYGLWLILVINVLCQSVASRWEVWFVAKLFSGIGVGSIQFCIPTYISELASSRVRGAMLFFYSLWFSVGAFIATVALQVLHEKAPYDWKTPVYTQWSQIGLMILVFIFLPESPWWLCHAGKHEQGKKVLDRLNGHIAGYDLDQEYQVLCQTVEMERQVALENKQTSLLAIFKGVDGFRTLISCWPLVGQQLLGLTLISTYVTYFFQLAGQADPFKTAVITNSVAIASIIVGVFIVDRVGRRVLLNSVQTIMWLCLLFCGILGSSVKATSGTKNALVFFATFWNAAVAISGGVGWAFVAEVASTRLRVKTAGAAAAISVIFGIITNVAVPYMISADSANWGLKTCYFFFGVGALVVIPAYFIIPETARRSPAALDELFEKKVRPWRFSSTKTEVEQQDDAAAAPGSTQQKV